jgi:uncharacterized protein
MKTNFFSILYILIGILASSSVLDSIANGQESKLVKTEFTSTSIPNNVAQLPIPYTRSAIRQFFEDGTIKETPLKYHFLFHSGDSIGQGIAGDILDKDGNRIKTGTRLNATHFFRNGPIFPSGPDGSSLISIPDAKIPGVSGNPLFLVTHFEHHSWVENEFKNVSPFNAKHDLPMSIGLTSLNQDPKTGLLTPINYKNIDLNSIRGIRYPCAASLSPWNTHLGGEEGEPNAKWYENHALSSMNLYLNSSFKDTKHGGANPYDYGFPIEISINKKGESDIKKRYAMGRASLELPLVMPDERTVYLSDDASDGVRLMFIADKPRDLTSGNLYAAKWLQTSGKNGGTADLKWIPLGHGNEKAIKDLIDRKIVFSDIFASTPSNRFSAFFDKNSEPFRSIYVSQGFSKKPKSSLPSRIISLQSDPKANHLALKPEMKTAAAFLETRRYAAYLGATTEFTKMEGQALNKHNKKIYTAISSAKQGMLEGNHGKDIRLEGNPKNLSCGIIYESDLTGKVIDQLGNPIESEWVAVNMKALLLGKKNKKRSKDQCDVDAIASPDNLKFSESMKTLFIAEDSGKKHLADYLWAYSIGSKKLARILISPKDSEPSGLQATANYNGHTYIMTNFQREIYPEDFAEKQSPEKANKLVSETDLRGIVGYLGPVPSPPNGERDNQ